MFFGYFLSKRVRNSSGCQKSVCKLHSTGSARGGSGIPIYPKKKSTKYPKIPQIPPNIPKNNRSFEYFIPEIQRKWYTEYPYLSCNIPYTRFKTPLNTEYPKTLADPDSNLLIIIFCFTASITATVSWEVPSPGEGRHRYLIVQGVISINIFIWYDTRVCPHFFNCHGWVL